MFLKRNRRGGYEYWTLVQSERTARGPRQRVVAHLGKQPGLDDTERHGWEALEALLEGRRPARQPELWEPRVPAAYPESSPSWARVDLRGVRVERVRDFGVVYLALSLWRRLGLHRLLRELIEDGREAIEWELVACILTIGRFCARAQRTRSGRTLVRRQRVGRLARGAVAPGQREPVVPRPRRAPGAQGRVVCTLATTL